MRADGFRNIASHSERNRNLLAQQAKLRRIHRFEHEILLRLLATDRQRKHRHFLSAQFHGRLLRGIANIPIAVTDHKHGLQVLAFGSLGFQRIIYVCTIAQRHLGVGEAHSEILDSYLGQSFQRRPEVRDHLPFKPFLAGHHIARAQNHITRIHAVRSIGQDHHFRLLLDFCHAQKLRLAQGEEDQAHDDEP